ncbi:MAG: hypothetical protein KKD94_05230 [Nanoarchaeota archaeon]|nr:hypothetical protein [Nanoarchaeota archaeon]MBU1988853.1 hypothetical protein [Nanoarchaeota archaeon]
MAKICIVEDDEMDLVRRYSEVLKSNHQVAVVLDRISERDAGAVRYALKEAELWPLPNASFHYGLDNLPTDATLYFSDGLCGSCLDVAKRVGKERVYVNTSDCSLEALAKEQGLRILDRPIKDIISELD